MPTLLTSQLTNPLFTNSAFAEPNPPRLDEAKKSRELCRLYGLSSPSGISGFETSEGKRQFKAICDKLMQLGFVHLSNIRIHGLTNNSSLEYFRAQKIMKGLLENVYYVISQTPKEKHKEQIAASSNYIFTACAPGALQNLQNFYSYLVIPGHITKIIGAKKREAMHSALLNAAKERALPGLSAPQGIMEIHDVSNWMNLVYNELNLFKRTTAEFPDIWDDNITESFRGRYGQGIINYLAENFSAEPVAGLVTMAVLENMPKFDFKVSSRVVVDYFRDTLGLPCPANLLINLENQEEGVYKKNIGLILEDLIKVYFHTNGLKILQTPELEKVVRRLALEEAKDAEDKQVVYKDLFEGNYCVPEFLVKLGVPKDIFKGKEKFNLSDIQYVVTNQLTMAGGDEVPEVIKDKNKFKIAVESYKRSGGKRSFYMHLIDNSSDYANPFKELEEILTFSKAEYFEELIQFRLRDFTPNIRTAVQKSLGQDLFGYFFGNHNRDETLLQWAIHNNKFDIFKKILEASDKIEINFLDFLELDVTHHSRYFVAILDKVKAGKKVGLYVDSERALRNPLLLQYLPYRDKMLAAVRQNPKILTVLRDGIEGRQSFCSYLLKKEISAFTTQILKYNEDDFDVMNTLTQSELRCFHDNANVAFYRQIYSISGGLKKENLFYKCTSIVDSLLMDSKLSDASKLYTDYGGALVTPFALINYRKRFQPDFLRSKFSEKTNSDYKGLIEYLFKNPQLKTEENLDFVCAEILFRDQQIVDVKKILLEYINQNDVAELLAYCEQYHRLNVRMQEARNSVFAKQDAATEAGKAFYKAYIKSYIELPRDAAAKRVANLDAFLNPFSEELVKEVYKGLSTEYKNDRDVVASIEGRLNDVQLNDFADVILNDIEISLDTYKLFYKRRPAEKAKDDLEVQKFDKLAQENCHKYEDVRYIISKYPVLNSEGVFSKDKFDELVKAFHKFPFEAQYTLLGTLEYRVKLSQGAGDAIKTAKDDLLSRRVAKFVDKLISNFHVNMAGQFEPGELPQNAELEAFSEKAKNEIIRRNLEIKDKTIVFYNLRKLASNGNFDFLNLTTSYAESLRNSSELEKVLLHSAATFYPMNLERDEVNLVEDLTPADIKEISKDFNLQQAVTCFRNFPDSVHRQIFIKAIAKQLTKPGSVLPTEALFGRNYIDYDDSVHEILEEVSLELKAQYFRDSRAAIAGNSTVSKQACLDHRDRVVTALGISDHRGGIFRNSLASLEHTFESVHSFTKKGSMINFLATELSAINGKVTSTFFAKCCAQTYLPVLCSVVVGLGAAYAIYRGAGIKWFQLDKVYASLELTSSLPAPLLRANPIIKREIAYYLGCGLVTTILSTVGGITAFAASEGVLRQFCYQTKIDPKAILVPEELKEYVNSR